MAQAQCNVLCHMFFVWQLAGGWQEQVNLDREALVVAPESLRQSDADDASSTSRPHILQSLLTATMAWRTPSVRAQSILCITIGMFGAVDQS
jgi:hypothetical protein